jgi:hypothetical protein
VAKLRSLHRVGRPWNRRAKNAINDHSGGQCSKRNAHGDFRLHWQLLDPNPRYSHVRMPSKPTPFPDPQPPHKPEPVVTDHSRWIFRIGRERYAFDFTSTVTPLRPEQAPVISIEEKRKPRGRKIQTSTGAG